MAATRKGHPADLRRLGDIPIPNPAIEGWLTGPQCRAAVEDIGREVFNAYIALLPPGSRLDPKVPGSGQQNLRRHAGMVVGLSNSPTPRWQAWVGNTALSYRPTRGQPYPRFIEYGKPTRGIPGGHQLQRAADIVAGRALEGAARIATGGMSDTPGAPTMGRGGGAPRPAMPKVPRTALSMTLNPEQVKQARIRAANEALRQRLQRNKKPPGAK